jgi:Putative MetA-pathway of phenol degradation
MPRHPGQGVACFGLAAFLCLAMALRAAAAEACPTSADPITTDRPDVTNSSIVVPAGSLQAENGINLSSRDGARLLDGTNTRLRLGVAPCVEFLIDLPSYTGAISGRANSGFSNVAPAIKWQLSPLPGEFDLSATAGVGLPTGATAIAGHGVQPYLQFPWSRELAGGWGVSGMLTTFFTPSNPDSKITVEPTFVLEKEISERAEVFIEYIGDYRPHAGPAHLLNSGAAYRLSKTQQIDFHVGFGLNHNAPTMIFGLGYSFRFDQLF